MAQRVLTQFEEHPDAWTRVPDILERSSDAQSKVSVSPLHHSTSFTSTLSFIVHLIANFREVDSNEMEDPP